MLTQQKPVQGNDHQIIDVMLPASDLIAPDEPLSHAQRRMEALNIRSLIVVDANRPVGIVGMHDLHGADPDQPIERRMQRRIPVFQLEQSFADARQTVENINIDFDRLPVVDDEGRIIGEVLRETLLHDEDANTLHARGMRIRIERPNGTVVRRWLGAGTTVLDAEGRKVGVVEDVHREGDTLVAFYVKYGLLGRKFKRLPGDLLTDITDEGAWLSIDKAEFKLLADVDHD